MQYKKLKRAIKFLAFTTFIYGSSFYSKHKEVYEKGTYRILLLTHNSIYITVIVAVVEQIVKFLTSLSNSRKAKRNLITESIYGYFLHRIIEYTRIIYFDILTVSNSLNTIVTIGYWTLFFYNKELVQQRPLGLGVEFSPTLFTNICEHLSPLVFTMVSLYDAKKYKRWLSRKFLYVIAVYYCMIILCARAYYGRYPYNALNLFKDHIICFICVMVAVAADLLNKFYYELDVIINKIKH